jgi:hypothetical protein
MMVADEVISLPTWLVVALRTAAVLVMIAVPGWWLFVRAAVASGHWYKVSDGTYMFCMETEGEQPRPGQPDHDVVVLRFANDGIIHFLDQNGNEQPTRGRIDRDDIELSHKFEGLIMNGTGHVTGNDKMEGTCILKFLDVRLNETKVIQKKAKWSLMKKQ